MTTLRVDFNERYGEPDTIYYELEADKPVFNVLDGVVTVGASMSSPELVLVIGTFKSAFITRERELTSGAEPSEDDSEIATAYATPFYDGDPNIININVYGGSSSENVAEAVKKHLQDGLW